MRFYLNIFYALLLTAMFSLSAAAQYTTLPAERMAQFDDYDSPEWTHTGDNAPGLSGRVLLNGTSHTHINGWKVTQGRTGYAGGYGTIIPPASRSNYAANLRNVAGASVESPYYADGIGTLYFEATNSENPYPAEPLYLHVYIATNMLSGSGVAPMQPTETGGLTYNWQLVEAVPLNYSSDEFERSAYKFNHDRATKFKLVRESATPGYLSLDDQFLVIDNIRVSYPASYVALSQLSAALAPAPDFMSGTLTARCRLNQFKAEFSVAMPTMSVVYRTAPPVGAFGGWVNLPLAYVTGSGSGRLGLEFEGTVPLPVEGRIEYYYTAGFDGYYVSPDFTGLNYTYPTESLAPQTLYQNGMGGSAPFAKNWKFEAVPDVTELPDSRILIFDDYLHPKWSHTGAAAPGLSGRLLQNGTVHTQTNGWRISEARTGYAGAYGLVVPQQLPGNYACNLRNLAGSFIESPLYHDGVGTIYFEAVNSEDPVDLHLYITTNMFDYSNWESVELGEAEGGSISNVWHKIDVLHLNYTTQGEFRRYVNKLNYRGKIKVKLVRELNHPVYTGLDDQFLVVDNLRISAPPSDVDIFKTEVVSNPGYPKVDHDFTVRCYVSNTDQFVPTQQRAVYLVHRWRYLTQQVDAWKTNEMEHVVGTGDGNGNDEIYEYTISPPEQTGDIEYYYTSFFGGYVYKSPDYTGLSHTYPSENLSPQVFRGNLAEDGEFTLRLREFASEYGAVYVVTDQHPNPIKMDLTGDHQWRGLVPLNNIVPTNLSWSLMAVGEYFTGAESYATNRTYWTAGSSVSVTPPNLPYGGICVETNASARLTVQVEDTGYMMVSFDSETREFLISRAQYQNFNAWPARDDYFSESSGQSDKQRFENTFDEWPLSEDQVFFEPFTAYVSNTNMFQRDPFKTPNEWSAGSAAYISERTLDLKHGPSGITNYRNLALRLKGGDPVLGLGYVHNTRATLSDGVKQIKFKARVGQKSDNTQICYHRNYFTKNNYVVKVSARAGEKSPENPSISVIVYYQDYQNFYEFRAVQRANPGDWSGNINDKRADLFLYKWVNGVAYQLKTMSPTADLDLGTETEVHVGVYNNNAGSTYLKCKYGRSGSAITLDYTDTSAPFQQGTFGVLSSECFSGFLEMSLENSLATGEAVAPEVKINVIGPALADMTPAQMDGWFVPAGVFAFDKNATPPGIYKVKPNQKLDVYLQESDYDPDSTEEPSASGTSAWKKLTEINVNSYEYIDISLDIKRWKAHFVMLQVGAGASDVAVDELELRSWHGQKIGLGANNNREWLATEAWVVSNGVGAAANQVMHLDHSRANPAEPQAVQSPLLQNGMGLMEFDYRVLRAPAKLTVQYKEERAGVWVDVNSIEVANTTDWAHLTAYLGSFEPGRFRVVNQRSGAITNAMVEINNVIVWDEPYVDDKSWTAYNTKITAADPMRLLLDKSKGCFLNNSETAGANPSPMDRDVPHLRSPTLVTGLGTLTFKARAYDPGQPGTLYVYASTNGWNLAREFWTLVYQVDNIDHKYYQTYSFKPIDGAKYDAIRLETKIGVGLKRVCVEEVIISEPVHPGFDIVNIKLRMMERDGELGARHQPLAFEDVHVEAMVANQQLSPSNIVLYLSYYVGDGVWGVDNWPAGDVVTKRMHPVAGVPNLYRTRDDEGGVPGLSQNLIGGIVGQSEGTFVQYRVWASYMGGIPLFKYQKKESFQNPAWYYPMDINQQRSAEGWSPYYLVYGVPEQTVWVNEINVGDVVLDANYKQRRGVWEWAYIEIAMPAWLDLGGWKVDLVTQNSYVTHTIQIPYGLPNQAPVTNGYAFFVINESARPSSQTPMLPKSDFAYAGLGSVLPRIVPGGIRLRRPEGMYEQAIVFDDAMWNGSGSSYSGQRWAENDPEGRFVYVGEEQKEGSLSRTGWGDSTNTWVYPLFPQWTAASTNFAKNYTPGMPNGLQPLPNGDELFPGISNALINSSITQLKGTQNGRRVLNYSLRVPMGATTNIVYDIDDWYRLVSLKSNNVEQLPPASAFTSYNYDVMQIQGDTSLTAKINLREDLQEYQGDSAVLNWVLGFTEGPLIPMFYNGRYLTLKEQHWLDANPTVSNEFRCVIRDFSLDAATNLHVRLEMKLNESNMEKIQGGAVLKLQAKEDLTDNKWDILDQFYLTPDSFDSNNECRVFVRNPFGYMVPRYDGSRFFLRWVIEMDDPRLDIRKLVDEGNP
ncbi:MAG: hypothetical protein PHO37_10945 [Kiritimatiellae bacterium]|nr:hypothetical protein [Kiritimatiellia bacterium]